jgi:hypothetical protein
MGGSGHNMSEARGGSGGHGADTSNEQAAVQDEEQPISMDLLDFQKDIVEELLNSDGLAIMGKGLGLCTVVAALVLVHNATKQSEGVVIILGVMTLDDLHFVVICSSFPCIIETCPQAAPTSAAWTAPRVHCKAACAQLMQDLQHHRETRSMRAWPTSAPPHPQSPMSLLK